MDNPDFFHMKQAYDTIKAWFEKNNNGTRNSFKQTIKDDVKFIWYNIGKKTEIESTKDFEQRCRKTFQNLNIGKIPLTNAELIKALFFINIKNNADTESHDDTWGNNFTYKWNHIEDGMQNDEFYYFLTNKPSTQPTNMDFLLKIIAEQKNTNDELKNTDPYFSFYVFDEFINKKQAKKTTGNDKQEVQGETKQDTKDDPAQALWEEIKNLFMTLQEWFYDNTYYHLIGYLNHKDSVNITNIIDLWNNKKTSKSTFKGKLTKKIAETLTFKNKGNKDEKDNIGGLSYDEDYGAIKDVLLLFNIISYMNSKSSRFPFKLYATRKWSLEHIHAQQSKELKTDDARIAVLKEQKEYLNSSEDEKAKTILKKIDEVLNETKINITEFEKIQQEIFSHFTDDFENIHSIDNLALLSGRDSSSLNNSIFPIKRKKILAMEKDAEKFIPLCTKNVFLKYYNSDPTQIVKWTQKDRDDYLDAITETLKDFLDKSIKENHDE